MRFQVQNMQKQTLTYYSDIFEPVEGENTKLKYLHEANFKDYEYYNVILDGTKYAVIAIGFKDNVGEIHFEVSNFCKATYRHMKESYKHIIQYCKDNGISMLIAPRYKEDDTEDKWSKFVEGFGFTSRTNIRIASMEIE